MPRSGLRASARAVRCMVLTEAPSADPTVKLGPSPFSEAVEANAGGFSRTAWDSKAERSHWKPGRGVAGTT
jgi:hypothetical protein